MAETCLKIIHDCYTSMREIVSVLYILKTTRMLYMYETIIVNEILKQILQRKKTQKM